LRKMKSGSAAPTITMICKGTVVVRPGTIAVGAGDMRGACIRMLSVLCALCSTDRSRGSDPCDLSEFIHVRSCRHEVSRPYHEDEAEDGGALQGQDDVGKRAEVHPVQCQEALRSLRWGRGDGKETTEWGLDCTGSLENLTDTLTCFPVVSWLTLT
jgi:hypothetical protein